MAKKIRKAKIQTVHGVSRIKERTDFTVKKEALALIRNASKHGKTPHFFRFNKKLHKYLLARCKNAKRVRVYRGYVFIFNGGSDRLITMYPLKDNLLEEYKEYVK